jgi:hypothetical protein
VTLILTLCAVYGILCLVASAFRALRPPRRMYFIPVSDRILVSRGGRIVISCATCGQPMGDSHAAMECTSEAHRALLRQQ